ncbi:hypothetical protein PG991_009171 [Apiospora marii]|uniref:Tat pathway signal sequence n=1 Tax=Apiospora marii TaxID=335849 RepID=A0ABR1RK73_9PEZI
MLESPIPCQCILSKLQAQAAEIKANLILLVAFASGWFIRVPDLQHAQMVFQSVIVYEKRPFDAATTFQPGNEGLNHNKPGIEFVGPPRPELEEAWGNLMAHENVRVSTDELDQYSGEKSLVRLTDGSGYYMTVSVFHGLHCIQRLHRYIYRDHYYPKLTEDNEFSLKVHTHHCLDWLRQYVQCNADTTLIPIRWAESIPTPIARDTGERTCVAWQPIMDFMKSRSFDPLAPGMLNHPVFGDPYSNKTASGPAVGSIVLPAGNDGFLGD